MKRYATASALAIVAMAGQAWADVTPQQVWDDFEAYMSNFGYQITATETMEGSSLVVSDITMVVTIPEEDGLVRVTMPPMTFAEAGEGSVSITYPEVGEVTLFFVEDEDEVVGEVVLEMTHTDLEMLVSGNPGDLTYTYSGERVALDLTRVYDHEDEEEYGRDIISATMSMGPLSGTSHIMKDDVMRSIEQDMTMGDLALDVKFDDPEGDDAFMFTMALAGLSSTGTTRLPLDLDVEDPTSMFKNGGMVDAVIKHTGGKTEFSVNEGDGPTTGMFTSSGGEFGVAVSETDLSYRLSATDQTVATAGPELPLPINAALGEAGFALAMPLSPSEEPRPASLSLTLGGFTMDDMLWNIFDPGEVLPRDPATVAFSLEAMVTPFVSLLDPESMEKLGMTDGMPGELNSLTLNNLVVDALGAMVKGSGAFTFDNSDLQTFGGVPRPEGKLDVSIAGANGLVDSLISMGLLPEEDAMGFRMMMSMFTVPGEDPDTATSTIEVNAEGHVLANGQRIQ